MKKGIINKLPIIVGSTILIASLGGFSAYFQNNKKQADQHNQNLFIEENLLQMRIQMIELLSVDPQNTFALEDILNLIHLQSDKTLELLESMGKNPSNDVELIEKTTNVLQRIRSFAEKANIEKKGSKKEATDLTAELTNLILEWRQLH